MEVWWRNLSPNWPSGSMLLRVGVSNPVVLALLTDCSHNLSYCGADEEHCGVNCQSGCQGVSPSSSKGASSIPAQISTSSASVTVAPAESSASAPLSEPILAMPTEAPVSGQGGITTDGTCGASNGGTTCGDWPQGGCCSMYGYCGST